MPLFVKEMPVAPHEIWTAKRICNSNSMPDIKSFYGMSNINKETHCAFVQCSWFSALLIT